MLAHDKADLHRALLETFSDWPTVYAFGSQLLIVIATAHDEDFIVIERNAIASVRSFVNESMSD